MYVIEFILLNQSNISLLGVIRQILTHAQFRVTLFDNYNSSLYNVTYAMCFSFAEPNVNEQNNLFELNCIRFGA